MAWAEVPAKLATYDAEEYAQDDASNILILSFDVTSIDDIGLERRDEFEEALDYRLNACINLRASKGVSPDKLRS